MTRKCLSLTILATAALALSACGKASRTTPQAAPDGSATPVATGRAGAADIALTDAVIRLPLVAGSPGVAYFTLSQAAGAPRKLVGVSVAGVGRAEMHESRSTNGVMSMDAVRDVAIEPGKTVAFAPGGYHVMLFGLDKAIRPGTTRDLTATFDNGDKTTVKAKVKSGAGGGMGHMDGM